MRKDNTSIKQQIAVLICVIAIAALFIFFLSDIMIPLLGMEFHHDVDGARELLSSRGVLGAVTVILVEALQMVVVFIPAEFIQISSGLSYPFPLALLLCDLGVCLGATMIFVLIRAFRYEIGGSGGSQRAETVIGRLSARTDSSNTQLMMYLLFVMPVVPFGAICYYGSGRGIRYGRYLFTAATGAVPSIIVSNMIGTSAKAFITHALPLPALVLIIIASAAALLAVLWLVATRILFKDSDGTPDSPLYDLIFRAIRLWRGRRQTLHVDNAKLQGMEPPFVVLCNHESFYDFYYISELLADYRPSYVINQHITSAPVLRHLSGRVGMIPKKLFYIDTAAFKIARTLRAGYPVVIFPEGRLSLDGTNNPVITNAAILSQKLKADLVIARISGAYFAYPKWRRKFYRSHIYVTAERILTKEETGSLSSRELEQVITEAFVYDESAHSLNVYSQKRRAEGLEHVLYRCADCGALYTTRTKGADLWCVSCKSRHHLDETYHFTDEIGSIPAYYDRIRQMELNELKDVLLTADVRVKIFARDKVIPRREEGTCRMDRENFRYRSQTSGTEFTIPVKNLPALAFSCNSEFELYYNNEQYYFYPRENRHQVARWALIVDLIRKERHEGAE